MNTQDITEMRETPLQWSRKAEMRLTMRRMGGERGVKSPTFWAGRPSMYHGECPIIADGELLSIAHDAIREIGSAQCEMHDALTSGHEYTDRDLQAAQESLRKAIANIETLRQRIIGAGEILDAIEAGERT